MAMKGRAASRAAAQMVAEGWEEVAAAKDGAAAAVRRAAAADGSALRAVVEKETAWAGVAAATRLRSPPPS